MIPFRPDALIIFARQPVAGSVKTRLCPPLSPQEAAELYGCMIADTLAVARELTSVSPHLFYDNSSTARDFFLTAAPGFPLYPQCEGDLGARMTDAFRTVFSRGYRQSVIIGTDSPHIPPSFVTEAFDRLATGVDVVFGPTSDGGYYLLGMKELQEGLFRDIAWSSSSVLRDSIERVKNTSRAAALLPEWYDLDSAADLSRLLLNDEGSSAPLTRHFLRESGIGKRLTPSGTG